MLNSENSQIVTATNRGETFPNLFSTFYVFKCVSNYVLMYYVSFLYVLY